MNGRTHATEPNPDADFELAVSTLVISFTTDPTARWMYDENSSLYLQYIPMVFRALGRDCARAGTIVRTIDRTGVALWLPPNPIVDEAEMQHALAATVLPHLQDDIIQLFEWTDQHQPTEPFWYLSLIGVEPLARNQGRATALIEEGLRKADADHRPSYLWSSNLRNVPLYERHGFKVIAEARFGSSPLISAMLRPAR